MPAPTFPVAFLAASFVIVPAAGLAPDTWVFAGEATYHGFFPSDSGCPFQQGFGTLAVAVASSGLLAFAFASPACVVARACAVEGDASAGWWGACGLHGVVLAPRGDGTYAFEAGHPFQQPFWGWSLDAVVAPLRD